MTSEEQVERALADAEQRGPLRALVHCAGRGGPVRLVERDGSAGAAGDLRRDRHAQPVGTFNVLRLAAARMARNEPLDGDRGVCVLTASVAAFEGQIGQIPYASSKAGIAGMTIVAARDLAQPRDPRLHDRAGHLRHAAAGRPARGGRATRSPPRRRTRAGSAHPDEFAQLALHIVENAMLNGETIRLDGAIRMAPR